MATITYRKFDEQGYFKAELRGTVKRTVRESVETLRRNGFSPVQRGKAAKLPKAWSNGRGVNAYII